MPAPDTAGQNFEALTGYIGGIGPAAVREELEPFLTGYSGYSGVPLAAIVAKFQVDPTDPEDPVIGLLGTVREKISEVDHPGIASNLTVRALGSVASALDRKEFKPESFEAVESLIEEADKFVELIDDDPRSKAEYYMRMASSLAHMDLSATESPDPFFGIALSGKYLDKAVEAAKDIEDNEALRVRTITEAASQSVNNIHTASEIAGRTDQDDKELPPYMYERPVRLYQEAFAAADTMENRQALYELQVDEKTSAAAMIEIAAGVKDISPNMQAKLLSLALERIDKTLADHESGAMASSSLHPRWHAYIVAHMGKELIITLGQQYDHGEGIEAEDEPLIDQLEERAFTLLRAATEKVQALEGPQPENQDQKPQRSSSDIIQAALVFANRDIAKVIDITNLAFAAALAEKHYEAMHEYGSSQPAEGAVPFVVEQVKRLASKGHGALGFKNALSLYAHAHGQLAQAGKDGYLGEVIAQNSMNLNLSNFILQLERERHKTPVLINDISDAERIFLTHALEAGGVISSAELESISSIMGDEGLREALIEEIKSRRESDAKAKAEREAPKTQIERLSRELVRNMSQT